MKWHRRRISRKMVLQLAMMIEDKFPGQINLAELAAGVKRIAERSAPLKADFGEVLQDRAGLMGMLAAILNTKSEKCFKLGECQRVTPNFNNHLHLTT